MHTLCKKIFVITKNKIYTACFIPCKHNSLHSFSSDEILTSSERVCHYEKPALLLVPRKHLYVVKIYMLGLLRMSKYLNTKYKNYYICIINRGVVVDVI